jgi:imidazoleglycerol-phosphate dehydratase/histidinol-phosphatase
MSTSAATLFIDRDGTLIEEPAERQVDSLSKVRFMPGVFAALGELVRRQFRLVMITNQDDLGEAAQRFILEAFRSQGVEFEASPLVDYLRDHAIDPVRSAVIGDSETDLELASNLEVRGLIVRRNGTPEETWPGVLQALTARRAQVLRQTGETRVAVRVNLDADQPFAAATGIGFFDHMLEQLGKHAGVALELTAQGDLHIDEHHTVEDSALALGEALRRALGPKDGIARYGFLLPMDEAEAVVALDLAGRPFSEFKGRFPRTTVGTFPTELVPHFFRSLSDALGATIHINVRGENTHHMVEACFKGFGRALRQAIRRDGFGVPSSKGVL